MTVSVALLLTLSGTILLASAQGPQGYDLTVRRPFADDINRILLECVDAFNGVLIEDPKFFRNGVLYNLPQRAVIPNMGVRFVVDRSSEGNFSCGEEGRTSVPAATIVGE